MNYHLRYKKIKLTHLMFADDLLLFAADSVESSREVRRTSDYFSQTTGLFISDSKSNVVFSGASDQLTASITNVLNMQRGSLPVKYLGVPLNGARLTKGQY